MLLRLLTVYTNTTYRRRLTMAHRNVATGDETVARFSDQNAIGVSIFLALDIVIRR
jgi:hypothetical protein